MEKYIGTKVILAEPMTDFEFSQKVRPLPQVLEIDSHGTGKLGYLVVYEDGYKSWSPRETFERAYRKVTEAELKLLR